MVISVDTFILGKPIKVEEQQQQTFNLDKFRFDVTFTGYNILLIVLIVLIMYSKLEIAFCWPRDNRKNIIENCFVGLQWLLAGNEKALWNINQ